MDLSYTGAMLDLYLLAHISNGFLSLAEAPFEDNYYFRIKCSHIIPLIGN